jgi:hypothetical protein
MIDILLISIPAFWVAFTCCLVWYLTSAKKHAIITFDDAKALWHIHKKNTNCTSYKWKPISHKSGKISGFECDCGFKYNQKRPLFYNKPKETQSHIHHRRQTAFSAASY